MGMSLGIIRLRLIFYLLFFFFELLGLYVRHIRTAIWSFAFLLLLVAAVGVNFISLRNKIVSEEISSVSLSESIPHQDVFLQRPQVEAKLRNYQDILKTQPYHRDILVNASLLERSLYNQKDAFFFWEEARKLDPNNELFVQ